MKVVCLHCKKEFNRVTRHKRASSVHEIVTLPIVSGLSVTLCSLVLFATSDLRLILLKIASIVLIFASGTGICVKSLSQTFPPTSVIG